MENLDVDFIKSRINSNISVQEALLKESSNINKIAENFSKCLEKGGKIILFGNGGSAADSQHIAAELSGKFYNSKRPGLAAISLNTNASSLTAIANDFSFDEVFSRQLEGLLDSKDLVVGISTSGNSINVFNGLDKAKKIGAITVSFTGNSSGKLNSVSDFSLCIPSKDTPRIQESHILVGHIICEIVEKKLFG
tara:strand:+ start:1208 stop:1789 length:582 start_codon:yes stop_codon:yes gene_type:complete